MNGGKVLWLIDQLNIDLDSIQRRAQAQVAGFVPENHDLNLDNLLFKYGVRINSNLLLDIESSKIPIVTGQTGSAADIQYPRWWFHPIVSTTDHTIGKNMDRVSLRFANTIDTIRTKTKTSKTILLESSERSTTKAMPTDIGFEILRYPEQADAFTKKHLPVAVLVEGIFPSSYENQLLPEEKQVFEGMGLNYKAQSVPSKMIVVADGDIARNGVQNSEQGPMPLPLGMNKYDRYTYANKSFLLNAIDFLIDDNGLIEARNKEVKLRLIDRIAAKEQKLKWQVINIVLPLLFLLIFGIGWNWLRRARYGK